MFQVLHWCPSPVFSPWSHSLSLTPSWRKSFQNQNMSKIEPFWHFGRWPDFPDEALTLGTVPTEAKVLFGGDLGKGYLGICLFVVRCMVLGLSWRVVVEHVLFWFVVSEEEGAVSFARAVWEWLYHVPVCEMGRWVFLVWDFLFFLEIYSVIDCLVLFGSI